MKVNSHKLNSNDLPIQLKQLHDPPVQLFWVGANPSSWLRQPKLGIVGSRKATAYGRKVTQQLATEAAQAGVVVISGLAFGIDSVAHQAALAAQGATVAVLPGPLDRIYPASHRQLAKNIINMGGTLLSEYSPGSDIRKENFIARNRIIAGLSDALLVTQAASRSGSLHTANFALEQGKTVMAVPGEINVELNAGSNNLLKNGAVMVTEPEDIFSVMGIDSAAKRSKQLVKASVLERQIFDLINRGINQTNELANLSNSSVPEVSQALSLLEIEGYILADAGRWHVK